MTQFFKNFLRIIDNELKLKFAFLVVLMFFATFIELFGIALVVPVLAIIVENDILILYPFLEPLIILLGNPSKISLVLYSIYALAFIYFLKIIFLTYLNWKQSQFVFDVEKYATEKLFSIYLKVPFNFHLKHNSSILLRNVTTEVSMISSSMTALTSLIIEILIIIGVVFFLIYLEPFISLIVFTVVGMVNLLFYLLTKKAITNWGNDRHIYQGNKFQDLQQGFGAIKDIKIYGRENYFIESYEISNRKTLKMDQYSRFINSLPRLWMELLAAISISILISVFIFEDRPIEELIPTIGVFLAAAFRVMPSFNRIINSLQTIRFSQPAVEMIYNEITLFLKESSEDISKKFQKLEFKDKISLNEINYKYPDTNQLIVKNISLEIQKGSSIGFIGETGSGKSTLLNLILGLMLPSSGNISMDGNNIHNNLRGYQDLIGFVPQNIYLSDDTICKNVAFGISDKKIDIKRVYKSLEAANLLNFVNDLEKGLETFVGEEGIRLSGGQKQRIGIARALYHNPSILVFDEATSALDIETEKNVMEDISELVKDKTLLIISHRINSLNQCEKIYKIENGNLVSQK